MTADDSRRCPECESFNVVLTQRGLAGPTDETDQFYTCQSCGRTTFEIVSKSAREIRMEKIAVGKSLRLEKHQYRVTRILKVGLDEFLVYIRPED